MASHVKQRNNKGSSKKDTASDPAPANGSPSKSKPSNNKPTTKFGTLGLPKNSDQVWSRFVLMTSVLIIVIVLKWRKTDLVTWVSQNELVDLGKVKSQSLICSPTYMEEVSQFQGCGIKQCGRFVIDGLFSEPEIETLLGIFHKGLQFGQSSGGASILDLHSGALSKGENFINVFTAVDKQLWSESELSAYKEAKNKVKQAVAKHFNLQPEAIHLTSPTFFSQMTANPAKTVHDEYWHPHVDKETYETFHFTSLLYLSDYGNEFQGGRFVFMDADRLNRTVEPRRGRVSMFTSGGENLHYVEKVTGGTRYALTIAFTCDVEKAIPDPQLRH